MQDTRVARLPSQAALAIAGSAALAVVLAVAPFVPTSRDGIDSTNFVLAVDRYDPAQHQPHPPGYPIHVAFARLVTNAYRSLTTSEAGAEVPTAAAALRLWSLCTGLLTAFGIPAVALALGASPRGAWLTTLLLVSCPLFVVTAVRPLSDVPGLLFALAAQVAMLSASNETARGVQSVAVSWPWRLLLGAALAGVAVGTRVQTAMLTVPLLVVSLLTRRGWRTPRVTALTAAAFTVGVAAWAVPLLAVLGPEEYWRLLTIVAADDAQGVEMLATQPSLRLLRAALVNTFVLPWQWTWLAAAAAALSIRGAVVLVRHEPHQLVRIAAIGGPYLAFHLTFQETASVRYALPVVVGQVLLMAAGASRSWPGLAMVGLVVVTGAVASVSAVSAYWQSSSPVAQSLHDIEGRATGTPETPAVGFHHAVVRAARGFPWAGRLLDAPVRYEWLEVAEYFTSGGTRPVWFLADSRRTDLALFDPRGRRQLQHYRWPDAVASQLGGIMPDRVSWHEIREPGWMLLRGWSLTPETHGVSRRDGHTPGGFGTEGRIRRRDVAAVMMIGGRNLGGPCDTGALVEVTIDGRAVAQWTAPPHAAFLQAVPLDRGALAGDGKYATLRVTARDAAGTARLVDVAIESFDLQSEGTTMAALGDGWHVAELDARSGRQWRWMDEHGAIHVHGFGADVELTLRGAGPPATSGPAPEVEIRVGKTALGTFAAKADFVWRVRIPASALVAADGRVSLESSAWFIPDERSGNGDRRRLSFQLHDVTSEPGT